MAVASLEEFVRRARSALEMPTCYWLEHGGWRGPGELDVPGTEFDPVQTLDDLLRDDASEHDRARHQRYTQGLASVGLRPQDLPHVASDCTGLVYWALKLRRPRPDPAVPHLNTAAIWEDAANRSRRRFFVPAAQAGEGALVVYRPGPDEEFGHIGILVRGPEGELQVIHCDAHNYLREPAPGRQRNAMACTGTEKFDERDDKQVVHWKPFAP